METFPIVILFIVFNLISKWWRRIFISFFVSGYLKITKGLVNITKSSGEAVKLRCEASGEPPPNKFEWLKYEAPVREEKNRLIARSYKIKVKLLKNR